MPLLTAESVQASQLRPTEDYIPPQAPQSPRPNPVKGILLLGLVVAFAAAVSVGGVWLLNRASSKNASADTFLWVTGQDKTWEQYQAEMEASGRGRLNEDEYDWQQQLLNDAYSNDR